MKRQLHIWLGALMVAILVASLVVTGCSLPQIHTASVPGGVPQEGIKVHGHWTIEVKNPDGTLVKRTEFENALTIDGGTRLCQILGRILSVGGWRIVLSGSLDELPFLSGSLPTSGVIAESSIDTTSPYYFKTLTVSVPSSGVNAHKLVLSGTATAHRDGQISIVRTRLCLLSSSVPPSSVYADTVLVETDITETTLTAPVSVYANQNIAVTVVISFF